MTRRQFHGPDGTLWDVWDVHPADSSYDRRHTRRDDDHSTGTSRSYLDPTLEEGWLCFQSGGVRRRFAPIPPHWADLPDGVLRVMLDIATVVRPGVDAADPTRREVDRQDL